MLEHYYLAAKKAEADRAADSFGNDGGQEE